MSTRIGHFFAFAVEGRRAWVWICFLCAAMAILGILTRYSVLQGFDLRFTREIQETTNPVLDKAMLAITFCGNVTTVIPLTLIAAALAWRIALRRATYFILASLVGLPVDGLLKGIWDRARPDASIVHVLVKYSGYSFPSGHAVAGTLLYGAFAVLAWIHMPRTALRKVATAALMLLPILIDVSRVYVGAHWISDVIGGSAVALALLIPLVKWYAEKAAEDRVENEKTENPLPDPSLPAKA